MERGGSWMGSKGGDRDLGGLVREEGEESWTEGRRAWNSGAYALLFQYDLWKMQCQRVAEVEQPAERRVMQARIEELKRREADVSARGRSLVEDRNVPQGVDSLNRMRQWIWSVEN